MFSRYYKWILERNFNDLNKGVRVNQVKVLNYLDVKHELGSSHVVAWKHVAFQRESIFKDEFIIQMVAKFLSATTG